MGMVTIGKTAPFDLYIAGFNKNEVVRAPNSFTKVLSKGDKLNKSGQYLLYTEQVRDDIESQGFAIHTRGNNIFVACHEITPRAKGEFNRLVTFHVSERVRELKQELKDLKNVEVML